MHRVCREIPWPEISVGTRSGLRARVCAVIARDDQLGQRLFGLHRVDRFGTAEVFGRQKFIVPIHERIADRHDFSKHVPWFVFERDVVSDALAHFFDAVCSFEQRHRDHDLRLLAIVALQLTPHQKIEFLIRSPQFHIGCNATES